MSRDTPPSSRCASFALAACTYYALPSSGRVQMLLQSRPGVVDRFAVAGTHGAEPLKT